jgi:histidinol dehydrogenase
MKIIRYPDKKDLPDLLSRPAFEVQSLDERVKAVIDNVRENGDRALAGYTQKFDQVKLKNIKVSEEEISEAEITVAIELKKAIALAIENIEKFHTAQESKIVEVDTMEGVKCWQKAIPIEKVGLYIPGGTAPLFSTVLMLAIPAKIAGCEEIILCSPPGKDGKLNPAIVYAARVAGVTEMYKVGGAQAIAAMAYGTETIPSVYKIFGPGNQYVTAAKQLVARDTVAIDLPAGPSEVAVLADDSSNPVFIASDLLSQAEHGPDSQVILISTSKEMIEKSKTELDKQLAALPRKQYAEMSLNHSKAFLVNDYLEMMDLVNAYAPEHLIISTANADDLAEKVKNAGSVFIGEYTPESAGDYASGTNHTLPTNGYAVAYSGVNLDAYQKKITYQKITKEGLRRIGPEVEIMAAAEELTAHQRAISIRIKN